MKEEIQNNYYNPLKEEQDAPIQEYREYIQITGVKK